MSRESNLKTVITVAILLMSVLPAANLAAQLLGPSLPSLQNIIPNVNAQSTTVLGFDCGLGTDLGIANTTPGPPPARLPVTGDTVLDPSCSATWDANANSPPPGPDATCVAPGTGCTLEPLVADNPENFASFGVNGGGGLAVELRINNLAAVSPQGINGFDITFTYNPAILNGEVINLNGLPFGLCGGTPGSCLFLPGTGFDNVAGNARIAMVALGPLIVPDAAGGMTLAAFRFDVVGTGVSPLTITVATITNPNPVPVKLQGGAVDSSAFWDIFYSGGLPNFRIGLQSNFRIQPNPGVPGSPLTLIGNAGCTGLNCTGPFTFAWDTDDFSGFPNTPLAADVPPVPATNPVTFTPPPPVTHRVTMLLTDAAGHTFIDVELLPLSLVSTVPVFLPVVTAGGPTAKWLGGIPPYSGTWTLCPGTIGTKVLVCTNPAPSIAGGPNIQTSSPSVTYKFAGVYTDTVKVTDSTGSVSPALGLSVSQTATSLLNVTGTPKAYVITLGATPTNPNTGDTVTFTATLNYAAGYPAYSRSADTVVNGTAPALGTALKTDNHIVFSDTATGGGTVANALWDTSEFIWFCPFASASHACTTLPANATLIYAGTGARPLTGSVVKNDSHLKFVGAGTTFAQTNTVIYDVGGPGGAANSFFDVFFDIKFEFGDGANTHVTTASGAAGGPLTNTWTYTTTHTYATAGMKIPRATGQETGTAAVSQIQETGFGPTITVTAVTPPLCSRGGCDFTFTPVNPTAGKPVNFAGTAADGNPPYTFAWNFGDGTAGMGQNLAHTYAGKGTFNVTMTITDSTSPTPQTFHVSHLVMVTAQPLTTDFTFTPANPTSGKPVSFSATTSGGTAGYTYSWNFGDGTPAGTTATPSHSYGVKNTYTVVETVTDANGATASATHPVVVTAQPITGSFSPSPTNPTAGKPVMLTATISGGTPGYTCHWDVTFPGGTVAMSTGGLCTFTFTPPVKGSYAVSLSITDFNGVTKIVTGPLNVAAQPLTTDFTFTPTAPTSGKPVSFTSTTSGGTAGYTSSWSFGDGTSGTGATTSHSFGRKGTFTVTLTTTDANGVIATATHSVVVAAQPLTADFSVPTATAGKPVTFSATVSGGTPGYTVTWNFGDGTSGTGMSVQHTYSVKSSATGYTVSITVTDANGASTTASHNVVVAAQPLTVTGPCGPATAGKPFTCTTAVSGGTSPYLYQWSVDGTNVAGATGPTFSTSFSVKGPHTIAVKVTDANGATASNSNVVNVAGQQLLVTVTCPTSGVTAGKPFSCTVSATGGTTPYTGTGTFSVTEPTKGMKTETFTVRDGNGVSANGSTTVNVGGQPLVVTVTCGTPGTSITAGKPFSCTVSATGGTTPYTGTGTFSVTEPTKGMKTETFSVTDGNGVTASGSTSVNVAAQPLVVTVTCPTSGVTAGQPFNCTVSATGGTTPYTGTGTFSRTEPTKGMKTETFNVTDANHVTASGSTTVNVGGTPLVVTVTCPTSGGTTGKPFSCTVSASGGTTPYTGTGTFSVTEPTKGMKTETFTVKDANGISANGSATVNVGGQPIVVTVTCGSTGAAITAGKPFSCTVSASGGTGPYTGTGTFSVTEPTKGMKTETFNVTDANGMSASGSAGVTVAPQPLVVTVTCGTPGTSITAGKPFSCTVSATGGTTPYTGTGTFSVTEPTKGMKTETFTVKDANGVSAMGSASVTVAGQPLLVTVTCGTATAGKPFSCTVSASGGTGPYSGTGTFSVTEPTKGTKTETFSVTDANGVTASGSTGVNVSPQPLTVDFSFPASITAGKPATFTATVSGGTPGYSFSWNFGDGTTAVPGNPAQHTYALKGPYKITLTISDVNRAAAMVSHTVTVTAQTFVVDFTSAAGTAGKPVTLTATVSGGTPGFTFSWSFGDSPTSTGTGSPVSHTYPVKGTFNVTLTAMDANGATATATHSVVVSPQTLVIAAGCLNGTAGKPVVCHAGASGGTPGYTFFWDVGKTGAPLSTLPSGPDFTTTFPVKGTFSIDAIVRDANGATARVNLHVTIAAQPLVIQAACQNGTAGKPINCNASASGGTPGFNFSWNFGDGSVGAGSPVTHTFSVKGTYTVKATVTDANGATASVNLSVRISPQPLIASFAFGPATAGKPDSFNATASGGTPGYSFRWSFGDGTTGTGMIVSHTYAVKGTFPVALNVTDVNLASVSLNSTITVTPQPLVITGITIFAPAPTSGKPSNYNANVVGGTGPYRVAWSFRSSDQTIIIGSALGNPVTFTFAVKGTFSVDVNVTDVNGAFTTAKFAVTVNPQPLVISAHCGDATGGGTAGKPVNCNATAQGGTGPFAFFWDVGKTGAPITGLPSGPTFSTVFPVKGTFSIDAIVKDANGAVARLNIPVVISPQPFVVDFSFTPTAPTAGKPVTFTASASGGTPGFTFTWNFGDGTLPSTGNPVQHSFAVKSAATGYSVSLTVKDANGATVTVTHAVTVSPQPLAVGFGFTPAAPTAGKPVTFTATVSGGTPGFTFSWSFGDSPTSTGTGSPVSHTYAVKGSFNVSLTVTDANGATVSVSHVVTVGPQPLVASFTTSTATAGKPVTFTSTTTGGTGPFNVTWIFGDGTAGTGSPVVHTYGVKGLFPVNMTVIDANGATASSFRRVSVAGQPLVADFSFTPTAPTAGKPVTFSATASGGTPGFTATWNFGDGTSGSGAMIIHTYGVKGTPSVTLTVKDANGVTATVTHIVNVAPQPITGDFTFTPANPTAGKPVSFSATATGGTPGYTFSWQFGEAQSGTAVGQNPTHTYSVKGTFTVTLTVKDANGATVTATHIVVVSPQPLVITSAAGSPNPQKATLAVTFTATITGGTTAYVVTWNFGDGNSATGNPVTHAYATVGNFTVTVTVKDANGATASTMFTETIIPNAPLAVDFQPTDTLVGATDFSAVPTGGFPPYTCSWTFGDGTPAQTGCDTNHTYTAAGSFTVAVTAHDSAAGTAVKSKTVVVEAGPSLIRGKIHWTHHLVLPGPQVFTAKVANPSTLTVTVTLRIDIFDGGGAFVATVIGTTTLAPGAVDLAFTVTWTPPNVVNQYTFTGRLSYSHSFGDLDSDAPPFEMVMGTDGSKSGSFTVVM